MKAIKAVNGSESTVLHNKTCARNFSRCLKVFAICFELHFVRFLYIFKDFSRSLSMSRPKLLRSAKASDLTTNPMPRYTLFQHFYQAF